MFGTHVGPESGLGLHSKRPLHSCDAEPEKRMPWLSEWDCGWAPSGSVWLRPEKIGVDPEQFVTLDT